MLSVISGHEDRAEHPSPLLDRMKKLLRLLPILLPGVCTLSFAAGEPESPFFWQTDYARMLPHGVLEWTPRPFSFTAGKSPRYIDFQEGDDRNDGLSPQSPWKHHPWDPAATGEASASLGSDVDTWIFKGGVIYRGTLHPKECRGTEARPLRLTSDPAWGEGPALFYGSETVRNWRCATHPRIPANKNLWAADLDFPTRALWIVKPGGAIERMPLAREPNWRETNPNDPLSEWWEWEQPEWWTDKNVISVGGKERHLGVDTRNLPPWIEHDLTGATVWTEWGIVMGSPYPARIEAIDREKAGLAFRGPWTFEKSERIITGNRYYLEDHPAFLNQEGEFWVEKSGDKTATLYFLPPDGANPNDLQIEAGRHTALLFASELRHVEISGFVFRFTNVHWDYNLPLWAHPRLLDAAIRLAGGGDGIVIRNNTFEHVNMPVRISASSDSHPYPASPVGRVLVADNDLRHTDHGAIAIGAHTNNPESSSQEGPLGAVEILRNRMEWIGWRNLSGTHGHAVDVRHPLTALVAGNFLHRIAGWGISVFGGKPDGHAYPAPFCRVLIMQNRVEDVLLKSNDWGGIETWQGGPHYVFNNLVINPRGFKNWIHRQEDAQRIPSFGHAYYLDGSFKNHLFNNLALGWNNTPGDPNANLTALQNIFSFENTFAQNTFVRFGEVTRQQAPEAGRVRYLGNLISDASGMVFRNADPRESTPDPNAEHYAQGRKFDYSTLAYANNIIHHAPQKFGVFQESGTVYPNLDEMARALEDEKAMRWEIGETASENPLPNIGVQDFRPAEFVTAKGVRFFVPWALADVVGEWSFHLNRKNPGQITDSHWNMQAYHRDRRTYRLTPRYPLLPVHVGENDFVPSPLETWVRGAVRLNGENQSFILPAKTLRGAFSVGDREFEEADRVTPRIDQGNLLVEIIFIPENLTASLVHFREAAGYALALEDGRVVFSVEDQEGARARVESPEQLAPGQLAHVVAEFDRSEGLRLSIQGQTVATTPDAPKGSLLNNADFLVGGGSDLPHLRGTLCYLRVARATLAEAQTSIGELFAWQFDGPNQRDFSGRLRPEIPSAGAIEP